MWPLKRIFVRTVVEEKKREGETRRDEDGGKGMEGMVLGRGGTSGWESPDRSKQYLIGRGRCAIAIVIAVVVETPSPTLTVEAISPSQTIENFR